MRPSGDERIRRARSYWFSSLVLVVRPRSGYGPSLAAPATPDTRRQAVTAAAITPTAATVPVWLGYSPCLSFLALALPVPEEFFCELALSDFSPASLSPFAGWVVVGLSPLTG